MGRQQTGYARAAARILAMALTLVLTLWGCATAPPSTSTPTEPPREPSPPVTSPDKELGKAFLAEALRQYRFVKDPEVTRLVNEVGRRVVDAAGSNPEGYHFLIVREPQLNAFSIPGGYIFFFEGLLGQINSVEELAGVMAHEVAHVQKNHFFKDQKKILAMDLATFAAILLGGPEAAVLAQGANINLRLHFSRENEEEADAAALIYLRHAGYNPEGLLRFFETLASYERFNPPLLPSYFSTHPGVQERLRTVSVLLRGVKPELPASPPAQADQANRQARRLAPVTGIEDWGRTAVILRSSVGGSERSTEDLKGVVAKVVGEQAPEDRRHYLLGLAYLKIDRIAQAIPEYQEALRLAPENAVYHADLAYCYLRTKKMDLARLEAERVLDLSAQIPLAYLVLGILKAEAGELDSAIGNYRQALLLAPDDPQIHWNLAQGYFKKDEKLMGAYHLGRYSRLNLEPDRAMEQFRHAQGLSEKGSELSLSIQKEMDEILREGV